MRPEEQRPEQHPDEITDLPVREATDADVADKIKGGEGTTTTLSNVMKQQQDTTKNTISNLR
jgi:hypothetical protein